MKKFKAHSLLDEGIILVEEETGDRFMVKGGRIVDVFLSASFTENTDEKIILLSPSMVDSIRIFKLDQKMMDTDFERCLDIKKNDEILNIDAIADISFNYRKPTFHYIIDGICQNCKQAMGIESIRNCPTVLWHKFKALHPNTPEKPDYSEASVKRWIYHIEEAEKNKGFEKVELDMAHIERIRQNARVREFSDFDYQKKERYLSIAKCYPGSQVFACGSQVRGDYFDNFNMDGIIQARQKAGMQTHRVSDYDYWVHPSIKTPEGLPNYADRYRGKFNEKEMVAIPVYYGDV